MSFDLCFWDSGTGTPEEIYNDATEGEDDRLSASENVLWFRCELLDRWVSFNGMVEPLEYDPDVDEQSNLDRYVLITVPLSLVGELSEVVRLARSYGLTIYDPQAEQVLPS